MQCSYISLIIPSRVLSLSKRWLKTGQKAKRWPKRWRNRRSHQCIPGSIPEPGVKCVLSLLLVHYSAPRGFSPSSPVFPFPQKPTILNSNSLWTIFKHFIMSPWLGWFCKHSLSLTLNLRSNLHLLISTNRLSDAWRNLWKKLCAFIRL